LYELALVFFFGVRNYESFFGSKFNDLKKCHQNSTINSKTLKKIATFLYVIQVSSQKHIRVFKKKLYFVNRRKLAKLACGRSPSRLHHKFF